MDLVLYSHIEYSDCWAPFFGELDEHLKFEFENRYICSNKINSSLDKDIVHIEYDDSDAYTDRLLNCLSNVQGENILFTHEDMILYDSVNMEDFKHCVEHLEDVDFIKLIKGGSPKDTYYDMAYQGSDILKHVLPTFDYFFAIQPTLWKKHKLVELLENNRSKNIWDFESSGQSYCKLAGFKGLYVFHKNDKKVGSFHWSSTVYPYIATAIFKGKWTVSEYPKELDYIFSKYSIDSDIRGVI